MDGLMMDVPLTLPLILRRAETHFAGKTIVTREADRSIHRYTYADCLPRARRLAAGLRTLGVDRGDRVGTLCWNHFRHLEAYYGVPSGGAVLHTLNIRLHPDELAYVIGHGGDKVVMVDASLWPLFEQARAKLAKPVQAVFVGDGDLPPGAVRYEDVLAAAGTPDAADSGVGEQDAAVLCYTSGTTGKPKGVLYSHRSLVLHTLGACLADVLAIRETDVVLAVVPMFHANAWGVPFNAALVGAAQVLPGPCLDPESLADLFERERVTITLGVPTIWMGILKYLDANPGRHDISRLRTMVVGGAPAPASMIRAFQERYGISVLHAWGMTETAPLGSVSRLSTADLERPLDQQYALRATQGRPAPLVEVRARGEQGLVPWDGQTMGELEVRGPWVAGSYFEAEENVADRWTADGWFRTGDIVTLEADGRITIQDRSKDLVKSGGEWISSLALEAALAGHPAIGEVVVIAVPDVKWGERPMAVVVPAAGAEPIGLDAIRAYLEPSFAKWWLPDAVVHVPSIPRTGTGKYDKKAVRAMVLQPAR